jgi:hypothetical protein
MMRSLTCLLERIASVLLCSYDMPCCANLLTFYCSSYPHGGWVLTGLILSCLAALASTMWGVSSCRFLYIDYTSDRGGFADYYLDPTPDGDPVLYRTGAGMFTWLVPFDNDWSDGFCQGYTDLQRDAFSDHSFETARIFAVLSVLAAIGVTIWTWFLACISLGKFQIYMMSTILGLLVIFCGFTFLIFSSNLCNHLVEAQGYGSDCTLDQGGLVTIAAVILWSVAALISIIYIKPPDQDLVLMNGQITNAFENRLEERRRRKEKDRKLANLLAEQKKSNQELSARQRARLDALESSEKSNGAQSPGALQASETAATTPSPPRRPPQSLEEQDGTVELQLGLSYSEEAESQRQQQRLSRSSHREPWESQPPRGQSYATSASSQSQQLSQQRSVQELNTLQQMELDSLMASMEDQSHRTSPRSSGATVDPPGVFQRLQQASKREPTPMAHSQDAASANAAEI